MESVRAFFNLFSIYLSFRLIGNKILYMKKLLTLFLFLSFAILPSFAPASIVPPLVSTHPVNEVVYITKSGTKYHRGTCHYLKKSKIKTTKSEAKSSGYSPCSVCKP